jgi:hypothetical protein
MINWSKPRIAQMRDYKFEAQISEDRSEEANPVDGADTSKLLPTVSCTTGVVANTGRGWSGQ